MKCFVLLLLVCLAYAAKIKRPGKVCESLNDAKLKMFNRKAYFMAFPCNYWALRRQVCGKWRIDMTPGVHWLGKRFYLDSVRISATNIDNETIKWEGKVTNKVAVKYFNNQTDRELFNVKEGATISTEALLETNVDEDTLEVYAEERENGDFRFSFVPWYPHENDTNHAKFKFECFAEQSDVPYPDQMCGDQKKNAVRVRAKNDFALENRFDFLATYYDLFMNSEVVQTNEKCIDATQTLKFTCNTDDQRMLALRNCHQILSSGKHAECVTKYSCDPMDVFNVCLRWACNGFEKTNPDCEVIGRSIDMCPKFASSGNLTERVKDANCYTDFLPF